MGTRVTFAGFPHCTTYNGPSGRWTAGDVREVSERDAEYLCGTFPGVFAREPVKVEQKLPAGPPRSAAASGPPRTSSASSSPEQRSGRGLSSRSRRRKRSDEQE